MKRPELEMKKSNSDKPSKIKSRKSMPIKKSEMLPGLKNKLNTIKPPQLSKELNKSSLKLLNLPHSYRKETLLLSLKYLLTSINIPRATSPEKAGIRSSPS
jgi:hypothetical protein